MVELSSPAVKRAVRSFYNAAAIYTWEDGIHVSTEDAWIIISKEGLKELLDNREFMRLLVAEALSDG